MAENIGKITKNITEHNLKCDISKSNIFKYKTD